MVFSWASLKLVGVLVAPKSGIAYLSLVLGRPSLKLVGVLVAPKVALLTYHSFWGGHLLFRWCYRAEMSLYLSNRSHAKATSRDVFSVASQVLYRDKTIFKSL
jgi:hypothetical protein